MRVLVVRRAGLVRRRVQGAELHERQLAAGARVQSAGPAAGPVRQRLAHAARPHAQLHQEPLANGRGGPVVLPAAHHRPDQRQVSNGKRDVRFLCRFFFTFSWIPQKSIAALFPVDRFFTAVASQRRMPRGVNNKRSVHILLLKYTVNS